jgi:hypothetical protein
MKKNVFMYLAVTALLFIGCTKMEQVYPVPSGELSNVPVELSGAINESTRAVLTGPVNGTTAPDDLDLSVFRADQATGYPTDYDKKLDAVFEEGTTGTVRITPAQYYLVDASRKTKFIAVYPRVADAQYNKSNKTVEYEINGTTDILASTIVEGNKTNGADKMTFSHLLTQVKVQVVADPTLSAEELAAIEGIWGKVKEITLTDKLVTALVTLPAPSSTDAATIAQKPSTTATSLPLTATHTEGDGGLTIPIDGDADDFGYAMFLPVNSGVELNIKTTETGAGYVPKTTANTVKFEAGKRYTITIRFKAQGGSSGLVITVANTGDLNDWTPVAPAPEEI